GAAPADDEQFAFRRSVDRQLGDLNGDVGDLLRARPDHVFVVLRVVADISCDVFLLQPADAMFEAGRAGTGPRTDQPTVAFVRQIGGFAVAIAVGLGRVLHLDFG